MISSQFQCFETWRFTVYGIWAEYWVRRKFDDFTAKGKDIKRSLQRNLYKIGFVSKRSPVTLITFTKFDQN